MEGSRSVTTPIRVLIADDHRLFAEALEAILVVDGRIAVVAHAGDGREAVTLAAELQPDVVLMDVELPVLDGIEATRAIRAARPDACILMLTASSSRADVDRARRAGAVGLCDETPERRRAGRGDPRDRNDVTPAPIWLPWRHDRVFAVFQVLIAFVLVSLILMHSGRDAGMGGMGFTPASQGGTHIVERNLTRFTAVVGVLFFVNSIALFHYLK